MSRTNDPWIFPRACDSHLGTPCSHRFRPAVNRRWAAIEKQMSAIDAAFLLHGGLTRDGETHECEYRWLRRPCSTELIVRPCRLPDQPGEPGDPSRQPPAAPE